MKLHIGNIPKNVSDAELNQLVTAIAPALSVEIVRDGAGVSKGFGFADFTSDDEARAVLTGLNGREVGGQALKLGEAKPRKTDAPRPQQA